MAKLSTQQLIAAKKLGLNPDTTTPAQLKAAIASQSKAKLKAAPAPEPDGDTLTLTELAEALHLAEPEAREVALTIYGQDPIPRADLETLRDMASEIIPVNQRSDHHIEKAIATRNVVTGLTNESLEMAAQQGRSLALDENAVRLNAYLSGRLEGAENLYQLMTALDQTARMDRQAKAAELGNGLNPQSLTQRMGETASQRQKRADIRTRQRDGLTPDWDTILT